ncbi:MAG: response regulator [Burkholderiales bacterium]
MTIRVLLVDDHAVVRDGVGYLLGAQPDMRVIGSFGDGREAVRYAMSEHPDVAIVDIAMPGMNGIEVARQIHDACPATHILMLSMYANPEYVHQSFQAGAQGYVLKESAGSEVVNAVRAVCEGRRYFSRRISGDSLERYLGERAGENPLLLLSARERQVLQLVVEGRTSAEAAQLLHLSPKSVETYRSRVLKKLELEDVPALVKFAIRYGVTSVE